MFHSLHRKSIVLYSRSFIVVLEQFNEIVLILKPKKSILAATEELIFILCNVLRSTTGSTVTLLPVAPVLYYQY
jgi:hypothetical protein